ncbi:MAG: SH3 domain-containing protein, partial [Lachnospiraceae bacterium]|nr:SH3 domain-containing protein [Lachnospiraceae bacterium]
MRQIGWFFQNLAARLQEDRHFARRFLVGLLGVILVVVLVIVLISCGKDEDGDAEGPAAGAPGVEDTTAPYPVPDQKDAPLEEDAHADVNALIGQYFTALAAGDTTTVASIKQPVAQEELIKIEKESAYIEEFSNIKVYTKKGPVDSSYIVLAYYEIKFRDIERMAPGLTTFYVVPRPDGSIYITGGDMDQRVEDYIKAIVKHDDVAELFATVNTRFNEAVTEDNALKAFMEGFSARVEQEVSETMEAMNNGSEGDGTAEQAPASTEEICTATDTVNVRSSDSENGDKIGKLQKGEKVTRYEAQENGWSRVSYNGTEAFVKSDFLQVDEAPAETQTAEGESTDGGESTEAAQTTTTTTTDTSSLAGKSTVNIKESVNVRKSASQDADKIGVAYQGENYKLLQAQADGWCKIEFNGQTGYVKSEFVQ